jgi:hypothetical protein
MIMHLLTLLCLGVISTPILLTQTRAVFSHHTYCASYYNGAPKINAVKTLMFMPHHLTAKQTVSEESIKLFKMLKVMHDNKFRNYVR